MAHSSARVYCAGPLFNRKEQEEMKELAAALEAAGYGTFLPQRDGLELTNCIGWLIEQDYTSERAYALISEAIFALDVYQVLHGCDAIVANLNGRVPDEGAVSEVAMAWARGKIVVGYKADSRSALGGQDNPLVAGLFQFRLCRTPEEVVEALGKHLASASAPEDFAGMREQAISSHAKLGQTIWAALQQGRDVKRVVEVIVEHNKAVMMAAG